MTTPTTTGAPLTEQSQRVQHGLRARALRDFLTLAPLWKGDPASFSRLVTATMPLVRSYQQLSATAAASYYQAFRSAEQVPGTAVSILAPSVIAKQVATSMYVTGEAEARSALQAGASPEQARSQALARMSGAVARHVLNGGRDTIMGSVAADPRALGWYRVTDGNPCAFCLTLASRGAVYKTEDSADFLAHDACGCGAQPLWEGTKPPASTAQWKRIYNAAQRQGVESGDLQHGENSSKARLNAVRRYLTAQAVQMPPDSLT